jgi:hypothetical protein
MNEMQKQSLLQRTRLRVELEGTYGALGVVRVLNERGKVRVSVHPCLDGYDLRDDLFGLLRIIEDQNAEIKKMKEKNNVKLAAD